MKYKIYVQYLDSRINGYWLGSIYEYKKSAETNAQSLNEMFGYIKWYEAREYSN